MMQLDKLRKFLGRRARRTLVIGGLGAAMVATGGSLGGIALAAHVGGPPGPPGPPSPPSVSSTLHLPVQNLAEISPSAGQTMTGIGASGAWWPRDARYFPKSVQQEIGKMLFSRSGLHLSVWRFYIGGGGYGVDQPVPGESETGPLDRGQPGFYVGPDLYNWHAEVGERTFLKMAVHYHVPNLIAMSYSAPWPWTTNHRSCGGQIIAKDIPKYAAYLTKVVDHFHAEGINFSYVSPMNEPDDAFGSNSGCAQEGMIVPGSERGVLVEDLAKDLQANAPWAKVIAPDDVSTTRFVQSVPKWMKTVPKQDYPAALTYHGYNFPGPSEDRQVHQVGKDFDLPTWLTEICCENSVNGQYGAQYDPTIKSGLWLATFMYQALRYAHDSSFQWWVALSAAMGCDPSKHPSCATTIHTNQDTYNDGLVYYDPYFAKDHDYTLYPTKRFYVLGNYSRYVRPGDVEHNVSGAPAGTHLIAFASPHGHHWSVVAINTTSSSTIPVNLEVPCSAGALRPDGAIRTSATDSLSPVAGATIGSEGLVHVVLPPESITTYGFRAGGPGPNPGPAHVRTCLVPGASLQLAASPSIVGEGQTTTLSVTLTNDTGASISDASIVPMLPSGWTETPSGATGTASVASGGTLVRTFLVKAPSSGLQPGSATLAAQAEYSSVVSEHGTSLGPPGGPPGPPGGAMATVGEVTSVIAGSTSVKIPYPSLAAAYNNTAVTSNDDVVPHKPLLGFDGHGTTFSEQGFAANGVEAGKPVSADGLTFTWPDVPAGQRDDVVAGGQVIQLSGSGSELAFLTAANNSALSGTGTIVYTDGTTQSFTMDVGNFWYPAGQDGNPNNIQVASSFANYPTGTSEGTSYQHTVYVFATTVPINPDKQLAAVILPDVNGGTVAGYTAAIHIFALSVVKS